MDEAALMRRRQAAGNLGAEACDLGVVKSAALVHPDVQRLPLEELHGQEGKVVFLAHLMDGDDVIALDRRHGPRLAQKALLGGLVQGELRPHDLQRDRAL